MWCVHVDPKGQKDRKMKRKKESKERKMSNYFGLRNWGENHSHSRRTITREGETKRELENQDWYSETKKEWGAVKAVGGRWRRGGGRGGRGGGGGDKKSKTEVQGCRGPVDRCFFMQLFHSEWQSSQDSERERSYAFLCHECRENKRDKLTVILKAALNSVLYINYR